MLNPLASSLSFYAAQLQSARQVADVFISGMERMDRILLQATREHAETRA
jgi:hypothetical protein